MHGLSFIGTLALAIALSGCGQSEKKEKAEINGKPVDKQIYSSVEKLSPLNSSAEKQIPPKVEKQTLSNSREKRIKSASVVLTPTTGNHVKGSVSLKETENGVFIIADVYGLSPGRHGFHIHEKGDCSAPDASSAGAHFNPTNKKHGSPDETDRHVGDLGNLEADSKGHAHYERLDKAISLSGSNSIMGRAIIVHEKEDDYMTQPTGDAGGRVACGVIMEIK